MATEMNVASRLSLGRGNNIINCVGQGNVWIDEDFDDHTLQIAQEVMIKALMGTDPGDLELTVFDYNLRGISAPFSRLASDHLLRILLDEQELADYLNQLKHHVQGVKNVIQGRARSLADFRTMTGKRIEGYKLVVITADMYLLDDKIKETLAILLAAGPRAGVSFVIVSPSDADTEFLRDRCTVVDTARISSATNAEVILASCESLVNRLRQAKSDPVRFSEVEDLNTMWQGDSTDGITFTVGQYGLDTVRITMGSNREQLHNALITGAVGQGKSNLIAVIIHSLCQRYSPRELELYLLDFKEGVTLKTYANIDHEDYLPHAKALGLESDVSFGIAVLEHLYEVYEDRMHLFKDHGVQNLKQYRESTGEVVARIVVVIDEFQMMFEDRDTARHVVALLSKCTRLFRAAGIHFILASQTIASGIELSKDSDIFAQTPIRMAHRNSVRESEATLGLGNAAAADLKMGQAIVNTDYGALASNKKVLVALADDETLAELRRTWWRAARDYTKPPYVFDGNRIIRIDAALDTLLAARGGRPTLALGQEIAVGGETLQLDFGSDSGRNLAIFGTGNDRRANQGAGTGNSAIGMLQSAALSLARRNTKGDAQFVLCDMTDPDTATANNMGGFQDLMTEVGFPMEVLDGSQFADRISELVNGLHTRTAADDMIYLIGIGLDRLTDMPSDFGQLITDGPARGIHTLGWWQKSNVFEQQIGYGNSDFFDIKVLLRMDEREAQHILGPFIQWKPQHNRALIADSAYRPEPVTVIPFMPPTPQTCDSIRHTLL